MLAVAGLRLRALTALTRLRLGSTKKKEVRRERLPVVDLDDIADLDIGPRCRVESGTCASGR